VGKAAAKKAKEGGVISDDERRKLVSTVQSLGLEDAPKVPASMSGLETFSLSTDDEPESETKLVDAESLFNLPKGDADEDDEDEKDEQP